MTLTPVDFAFLTGLIKDRSGINLTEEKDYLLNSRLLPLTKKLNLTTISDLAQHIRASKDEVVIKEVVESMTTNESSFFRDTHPFELLHSVVIPHILEKCPGKKRLRIWSAACSMGQEPYSIAMTLKDSGKYDDFTFEILATDIANTVLDKAKKAEYSQFEVQRGVPISLLVKYFVQAQGGWQVAEPIRSMVNFEQCNLLEGINKTGNYDIVFCRNVLIYFDTETKLKVLSNLAKKMDKHSILYIGGAESLLGVPGSPFTLFGGKSGLYCLA